MMQQCVIQQYIDFLEKHSIDRHFYCRAGDGTCWGEWEVHWQYTLNDERCWGVKRVTEGTWQRYSGQELLDALHANGVDISIIESEMLSTIKSMIVYSNLMIEDSKQLLGEQAVTEAMMEYHAFSDVLVSTLRTYVSLSETDKAKAKRQKNPPLRLVT
ncbi:MAG: hypothetical protein P8104_07430 [Gammaproteobacteria bacterium]